MPSDDNHRDDPGDALPDWLRESGTEPIELNLPDDVDEVGGIDEDDMPVARPSVSVPSVSSVWVAAEAPQPSPSVPAATTSSATRQPPALVIAGLLVALVVIASIGLYVWQVW